MDREKMIDKLVENDIIDIRQNLSENDIEFLDSVLRGQGWKPYIQLTDKEIETEYNDRFEE